MQYRKNAEEFIHDNTGPYTGNVSDSFGYPPYTPDLAPSNFHLFLHLKSFADGHRFDNDKERKG